MKSLEAYQSFINTELLTRINSEQYQEPKGLYEPCAYILKNGGKRVRASLVLMAAKLFCDNFHKAIPIALAFETFHNFTLIHDDIMDDAFIRRGQDTVHVKWDTNTAILSGDAVMILAYRFFEEATDFVPQLFHLLNDTALKVCEGQQYDVELEKADLLHAQVTEDMYIKMIELKTSVLIAACLKAGAIIGGASATDADNLYEFGRNLGIAFQLQDDVLDTYGDVETFGKKIGGDVYENKKTILVIKALNHLSESDKQELLQLYSHNNKEKDTFDKVLALFAKAQVESRANEMVAYYFAQAEAYLHKVLVENNLKTELFLFMEDLKKRNY